MKVKVHELAKELGYNGTAKFIEDIDKIGVKGKKHHMNVLSDEEVSLIRKKLQKGVQNNQNNSKTENLNKSENKTESSTKENIAKTVSSHSESQKNSNAEHNKINESKNIIKAS